MICEAVIKSSGAICTEYGVKVLVKEIAEGNVSLVVQTAGDNCAARVDANLVAEGVTEYVLRGKLS